MHHKEVHITHNMPFSLYISIVLAISKYLRILKFLRKPFFVVITTRLSFDTSEPYKYQLQYEIL